MRAWISSDVQLGLNTETSHIQAGMDIVYLDISATFDTELYPCK